MNRELFKKDLLASFPGIGRIRRIAKVLNWLVGAGFVLFVAVNLFDESLRPEVAAYLEPQRIGVAEDRNAYFAMVGMAAPGDETPHAAGRLLVSQLEKVAAQKLKGLVATWPQPYSGDHLRRTDVALLGLCGPARASCIEWVAQNRQKAEEIVASYQPLLARYRALYGYPEYVQTRTPQWVSEPYLGTGMLLGAQRIFFVQTALQLDRGDLEGALGEVGKDIAFARKGLAGSTDVGTKASMNAHLANNLLFLSDVLAHRRHELGASAEQLNDVLKPLDDSERRLAEALRGEFVITAATTARMLQPELVGEMLEQEIDWKRRAILWAWRLFLSPNASVNRAYTAHKLRVDADAVSAAQFVAQESAVQAAMPSLDWTYVYNPLGKTIGDVRTDYAPYQYQMYDLDALVRLVALQAQLAAQRVKDEDVARFLSNADARYHNPYTNQPMIWDEKTGQLCYEPQSRRYGNAKAPSCCQMPIAAKPGRMCVRLSPAAA